MKMKKERISFRSVRVAENTRERYLNPSDFAFLFQTISCSPARGPKPSEIALESYKQIKGILF